MYIKCWGTRGSLPRATDHTGALDILAAVLERAVHQGLTDPNAVLDAARRGELGVPLTHGGNTTCIEVGHGPHRSYTDMGSGFREAGEEAQRLGLTEHHVFLTHLHWDHVMGLPLFGPVYRPGHRLHVYHVHPDAPEFLRVNFNGVNFPVKWDELEAAFEFHPLPLREPFDLDGVRVTPFELDHPGKSYGYRFDADGQSLAVGSDNEYLRFTREELGADLPFYQNLDLLVFDAQYEPDELALRHAWGHCTPRRGVDLALRERIGTVLFAHHDPASDDAKLRRMEDDARAYLRERLAADPGPWADQPEGPAVRMAYDGLRVDLDAAS